MLNLAEVEKLHGSDPDVLAGAGLADGNLLGYEFKPPNNDTATRIAGMATFHV
jgi:hypothetical protein